MSGPDFNQTHPELKAGEVFVGNNTRTAYRRWRRALPSLRRGNTAYKKSGGLCAREGEEVSWFPYFASAEDVEAIGGLLMLEVACEKAQTHTIIVGVDDVKYFVEYREYLDTNPNQPCVDCGCNEHGIGDDHEWAFHRKSVFVQAIGVPGKYPQSPIDQMSELGQKIITALRRELRVGEVVCYGCAIKDLFVEMEDDKVSA